MKSRIITFFLVGFLCSCSGSPETKTVTDSQPDGGISNPVQEQPQTHLNEFSGKVYLLGQLTNEKDCEIDMACDCCNSDLQFLTDSTFVLSSYCIPDEAFVKGTYKVLGNSLILKYDS